MSAPPPGGEDLPQPRSLTLQLDQFAWESIRQESARLGVSEEELVRFAVLYYLADVDSGRIARQVPGGSVSDVSRK